MQIYPVTVIHEMELTVCDNRFGRCQIQQYSVAFAVSFGQRAGIYTALIRERTPLSSIDFELIQEKPQLMAFSRQVRQEKLGGFR